MKNVSRDFIFPLGLGYYHNLSPFLISRFDGYKRYYLITDQKAYYENDSKAFSKLETTMLYRNMGLSYSSTLRPLARNLSTKSVIASFFRELITLESGSLSEKYNRIFSVMAHSINNPNASELQQFVSGYLKTNVSTNIQTSSYGTGLGLAIAREIVLLHNGKLSVSNDQDGVCFKLVLPIE